MIETVIQLVMAGIVVAIAAEIISRIITGQKSYAADYGTRTLYVALGISIGMSIAWAGCDLSRKVRRRLRLVNKNRQ